MAPNMLGSHIFKDKGKLSPRYVPSSLLHREWQLKLLSSFYTRCLDDIEHAYLCVTQLIGPVGTGKTSCALSFGASFQGEAERLGINLRCVYLNCKLDGVSRYTLYKRLLERAASEISARSLSPGDMLHQLLKHLERVDGYLYVIVDEIGYFCRRSKEQLVYDLTRLNEFDPGEPCRVVGVTFIARDPSFHRLIDPSELSTLGRFFIDFPRYTPEQVRDILDQRVTEVFKPAAIGDGVVDFISDVVVRPPVNGDLRVAFDLLLYSGSLAENLGFERVLIDHVRQVYSETHPGITTEDILNLNNTEKLILLGIARSLERKNDPYVSLREIREAYLMVCEERGVKPAEEIDEHVEDLRVRGIVDMKSLTKFGISDVPAEKLRRFLNGITERLKCGLREA